MKLRLLSSCTEAATAQIWQVEETTGSSREAVEAKVMRVCVWEYAWDDVQQTGERGGGAGLREDIGWIRIVAACASDRCQQSVELRPL